MLQTTYSPPSSLSSGPLGGGSFAASGSSVSMNPSVDLSVQPAISEHQTQVVPPAQPTKVCCMPSHSEFSPGLCCSSHCVSCAAWQGTLAPILKVHCTRGHLGCCSIESTAAPKLIWCALKRRNLGLWNSMIIWVWASSPSHFDYAPSFSLQVLSLEVSGSAVLRRWFYPWWFCCFYDTAVRATTGCWWCYHVW